MIKYFISYVCQLEDFIQYSNMEIEIINGIMTYADILNIETQIASKLPANTRVTVLFYKELDV